WTRKHRSQAYAQLAAIMLPHDYVNFWLTGERWMECGDASGTGWLDVRNRRWSEEMLRATDPDRDLAALLPPLVEADATFPIAAHIADALGLPRNVRVSAGGGDNMMAAIGTGNVTSGVLSMSLGTSGTLFAYSDRAMVDDAGRWAAFCASTWCWPVQLYPSRPAWAMPWPCRATWASRPAAAATRWPPSAPATSPRAC